MPSRIRGTVGTILSGVGGLGEDPQVNRFVDCATPDMLRGFAEGLIDLRQLQFRGVDASEVPAIVAGSAKLAFGLFGALGHTPRLIASCGSSINLTTGPEYNATRGWPAFVGALEHSPAAKAGLVALSDLLLGDAMQLLAGTPSDNGKTRHELRTNLIRTSGVKKLPLALCGVLAAVFPIHWAEQLFFVDDMDLDQLRAEISFAARSGSPC